MQCIPLRWSLAPVMLLQLLQARPGLQMHPVESVQASLILVLASPLHMM